jgi:hypothetical protein
MPARSGPFSQAESMHNTAYVVGIITHAESLEDGLSEAGCGPAVSLHAGRSGACLIDFGYTS